MRVKYFVVVLAAVVMISGCGGDGVVSVEEKGDYQLNVDDVVVISLDSALVDSETSEITSHVGGRILEISYRHYQEAGLSGKDIDHIGDERFRDNLKRLYRDLDAVIE